MKYKFKLKWDFKAPKDFDLCLTVKGKYCDVVNSIHGWHASYNNVSLGYFKTRREGAKAIEEFLPI